MIRLAEVSYDAIEALRERAPIFILPVGATEAHGPHLPLATDVIIAEAMAEAGGARLAAAGLTVVILPALAYTVAGYAAGFAGTISIRSETAAALVTDIGRALQGFGARALVLANAHLEPTHIQTLYAAQESLAAEPSLTVVYPDVTRKPWALRLTDEFKSGACHAGQYEGSIVMAARPDWVRDDVRLALPDNPSSLSLAIREGRTTFEQAGGPRAYFGYPARASAEEGLATITVLGEILAEATLAALSEG
ncbi:MAG: creatininase family protein [Polyangiaceae bacterium]|nr:creatininase family protein [Polyangiaceae bacterium]